MDESAPGADKIKNFAEDKGMTMGKFFDLSLYVTADGSKLGDITKTSGEVELKVSVPEELRKANRTFCVFKNHEGEVSEIGHGRGDSVPISTDSFSLYGLAYSDNVEPEPTPTPTREPRPIPHDDEGDNTEEPVKPAATNPDTIEGYFVVGGQTVPNVQMGRMKQGPAAEILFKASCPKGWVEAFTFNMAIDGKYEYTLKSGVLTIIIPKEYRKSGRTFAIMGLDKNANVVILNDTDTNPDTLTANLNIEGFAFDLIYKD